MGKYYGRKTTEKEMGRKRKIVEDPGREGMTKEREKEDGLTETVRKKKLDIDVNPERLVAHEFFLILAVCNTVFPIVTHRQSVSFMGSEFHEDAKAIDYQGESPDEQALVAAASVYGYTLSERTSSHIVVDVIGWICRG
ncbi:hypothetical protein H6P81_010246 [Aristolochia fimbriata]|uniref:Uncharacterized protein n=1 Tax=Aristolochia fimbriata TaxID=158543 RepID=A0AAV7ER37_ARIFI|nr:hypothetical protein H6P81_010246 [Aristolochia fimbriata]